MTPKNVMVDFDNTLVDFNAIFYRKIKEKYGYELKTEDCRDYDFRKHFSSQGIPESEYDKLYNIWAEDDDFYADPVFTNCCSEIVNELKKLKSMGAEITLHSYVPNEKMKMSKMKCLYFHFSNLFDNIILDTENGVKDKGYDLIVEDSPKLIDYYSNKGTNLWIVLQPYNAYSLYCLNNENVRFFEG